ncbi:MAG: hypothetical protein KAG97_12820, partial [Victivallales bacterium]|nr:hypothetical protein [Victivallales bacterium]
AGHKSLGDWQAALGINLRCQHLAWYTMLGQAKRDYPASIFQQSPWWDAYAKVEDHFARIHSVMTCGREIRELLVIHPNESMWTLCGKGWTENEETEAYNRSLIDLRDSLLSNNIDFDYGDEDILARHAKVARKNGTAKFAVAKADYSCVLVPPLKTMRSTTLDLLAEFKVAGGHVVFAGASPLLVDAISSEQAAKLAETCDSAPPKGAKLADTVAKTARVCSVQDENGKEIPNTLHLLKKDSGNHYFFVCNTSQSPKQRKAFKGLSDPSMVVERKTAYDNVMITLDIDSDGAPLELDPDTGEIFAADAEQSDDGVWRIATTLPALGSRLFVLPRKKMPSSYPKRPKLAVVKTKTLKGDWGYSLSDDNVLVLDTPRFKIDGGEWNEATDILQVDHAVRNAIGTPCRGGQMVQPWARAKSANPKHATVELEYTFKILAKPKSLVSLALECPETFVILINGIAVNPNDECGFWCDPSLRRLSVDPAFLKKGANTLTLQCDYAAEHPGLEIV